MSVITKPIVKLLDSERFYAEIILGMDISFNSTFDAVAGVYVKDKVHMVINPTLFAEKTIDEQVAILKHECQHILFNHIGRSKELAPEVYTPGKKSVEDQIINKAKHMAMNIAADMSINPGIPGVPDNCVFPKNFELPDGKTFEWYMNNLKDNEKLKELTEYDGHSLWSESEGDKEALKEKIRQHVNQASDRAKAKGHLSSEEQLLIDRLNYQPKDWKGDLRRFVAKQTEVALESSKKKRNRRYGVTYPGVVKTETLVLGVAIDTSGSVSDEALGQFMAEVARIAQYSTVIVVEADSEIKNRYIFDPKKTYTVAGRGGTMYQPALDHFSKNEEIDGLIYFGDMDSFDEKLIKPKYPVLWAIVGTQDPPADWGSKTYIEVNRKG